MALRPTDFLTYYGFRRRTLVRLGVWSAPPPWQPAAALGPTVRSLHLPAGSLVGGIGSALPQLLTRGFADFDGIQQVVSVPAAQLFKSVASTNFATEARGHCIDSGPLPLRS